MYADDLIILAASLCDLQKLINICVDELNSIEISVNPSKCSCMRVGKRFAVNCNTVVVDNFPILWSSEIRYLGVYFIAGHVIKFNFDHCKRKFYRCLNSIISKTGKKAIDIVLSLTQSYCLPILLYAIESMSLTVTERQRLASPFKRLYYKLFSTFESQTIAYCQYYTGYLPLEYVIVERRLSFLHNICNINNVVINFLFRLNGTESINSLCNIYNLTEFSNVKYSMWNNFVLENNLCLE